RARQECAERPGENDPMPAQHVHAGLASVAGFPTRNAAQEHNDLAGNADAFNAFLPRRVASSETATKAMSRRTANAVRRPTSRRKQSAALHSADTKHARGRRSGKLAMFFLLRAPCQRTSPIG